jgi:parvulin-like peptidyl-prolyl isomerase
MTRRFAFSLLAFAATLPGCDSTGGSSGDRLAVAGDHALTIETAAELIAQQAQLPNQPEVIEAVAELWLDYALLAQAAFQDPTLQNVDVSQLVQIQVDQETAIRLRETVIQVDTTVTDQEVEEFYSSQQPGTRVRASHILLTYPDSATDAQEDSVDALAASLHDRIQGGEDFAVLARSYSADPGSAAAGGDLGSFGRGEMVKPFEDAAFALEVGEVSEPVESPFGVHLILMVEKDVPPLDERMEEFRAMLQTQRVQEAESLYVSGVVDPANIEVEDDAGDAVREVANRPDVHFGSRAARRALASYEGGSYTAGEFQTFVQNSAPALRTEIDRASDEQLDALLVSLSTGKLLLEAAHEAGVGVSQEFQDSVAANAREGLRAAADQLGLRVLSVRTGETEAEALDRTVVEVLQGIISGTRQVIPLSSVSFTLRRMYRAEKFEAGVQPTMDRVREIRAAAAVQSIPVPDTTQGSASPSPPDSSNGSD